ncbi:MAG: phage antirepressor KilAC domain-containing protein [Clostridia bacterium]|nr:phage antirepressor KilAC domain-containing protein [Clostridia bacterium]
MENMIQTFTNSEFGELEVVQIGNKFYFPATETAEKLGYKNPRKAVMDHCVEDGVTFRYSIDALNRSQEKKYIDEGNLYRLIVKSKLESARKFEKWVFDEVLPTIRKHGAYIMPELLEELQRNTEKNAELLAILAKEQREKFALAEKNAALEKEMLLAKPKLSYYDIILQNPKTVAITLIAKDYGMSAMALNDYLHEQGIQYKVSGTWALYQCYADNGYTQTFTRIGRGNGVYVHMRWTQKGRLFLYNLLKSEGILPKIERAGA